MRCLALAISAIACLLAAPRAAAEKLCFPQGFLLGSATASYQVEGAWNEGGRTPSIWDDYCRKKPQLACANVADDFYHRYEDDIKMMKDAGHNMFRFSISWSRVMNWDPATKHMKPNPPGLAFYHSIIDALNKNDITPVLTIYHWDLPSDLETQLAQPGGWRNAEIQSHFVEYSTLLLDEFGSKVDYWTTFNEPWAFSMLGYGASSMGIGLFAPGVSDSPTAQYEVAHNVLLSHAKVVQVFRQYKTQKKLRDTAVISIVMTGDHNVPLDPKNPADVEAAERTYQFTIGWFLEPIVSGDYPKVMRQRVGDRLPKFTPKQSALLKGSYDIFMLNHYNTHQVTDCNAPGSKVPCEKQGLGWDKDLGVDNNGVPNGAHKSPVCGYFSALPEGYRGIINWVSNHNKSTPLLLTENGFCGDESIEGRDRLWYHQTYLEQVHKAINEDKVPIIGYTAWSLLDNYEWGSFKPRFGLYYVNYTSQLGSKESWTPKSTDLARVPRLAAKWFAKVAQTGCMEPWQEGEKIDEIVPVSTATIATHWWSSTFGVVAIVVVIGAVVGFAYMRIRSHRLGNDREHSPLLR